MDEIRKMLEESEVFQKYTPEEKEKILETFVEIKTGDYAKYLALMLYTFIVTRDQKGAVMKPTDMGIKVPATSKEEFAEKMAEIAKGGDVEASHGDADELMCQVLTEWGYGDGVKIFEEMSKWYA